MTPRQPHSERGTESEEKDKQSTDTSVSSANHGAQVEDLKQLKIKV